MASDNANQAETATPVNREQMTARAWKGFFDTSGRVNGILEKRLKRDFGLSLSDYNILLSLWEAPNHTQRMGEIAERVVFSPSRVTYLITNLVRDGLVEKVPSQFDRRGFDACLTPQGEKTIQAATQLHQTIIRQYLLDDMSDEEIDQLVSVFATLESRTRVNTEALVDSSFL